MFKIFNIQLYKKDKKFLEFLQIQIIQNNKWII